MKLLLPSSDAEYFCHAGYGLQVELYEPILNCPQFLQGPSAGFIFKVVKKHQSHAGGYGPQLRISESLRYLFASLLETLVHELAAGSEGMPTLASQAWQADLLAEIGKAIAALQGHLPR